jgi:hypothetical protein
MRWAQFVDHSRSPGEKGGEQAGEGGLEAGLGDATGPFFTSLPLLVGEYQ